ncbi:MAG: rhodanese-like domain-containing protein [Acidiferrobacterales bacterium]
MTASVARSSFRRLVLISVVLGFALSLFGAAGAETGESDWHALVTWGSSGYQVKGATEIDVATAKALHKRGVPFVDVRGRSFPPGHIPGAYNLRWKTGKFTEVALLEIVDKDQEVVIYCGDRSCKLSPNACAQALTWGFKKVYYFADGFPGWKAAGYPVEVSSE